MAVLSVDLAERNWSDLGIVILDRERPASGAAGLHRGPSGWPVFAQEQAAPSPVHCEILPWHEPDPLDARTLAGRLNHLCGVRNIRMILLDGPQAWKSSTNGLQYARVSERQLNTAAKTGLPGVVKPATYRRFAEFCLDVYDELCRRGWRRLETNAQPSIGPERVLVESYPFAAWKSLGIKPLPAKRRARISDLAEAYAALNRIIPFTVNRPPNHDQLQAIVGGLAGLSLEARDASGTRIVGTPPRREEGHWREGFIVLPVAPSRVPGVRWLQ
jgi:hypothetical protein